MIDSVYAMGSAPQADMPAASPLSSFLPLILIFAVFYFLLIRPQRAQQTKHANMIKNLKKDDKILTTGGIYARIIALKGERLEVEVATNVRIMINKNSVSQLIEEQLQETGNQSKE